VNILRTARRLASVATIGLLTAAAGVGLGTGTAAAASQLVYTGHSTVTVTTYDYCDFSTGQRRAVARNAFSAPVTLIVSDRSADGFGNVETNPFHFSVQTDVQTGTGAFSIKSAQIVNDVVLNYWSTQYDTATGELQGQLTDSHVAEAAALNMLNVEQQLIPCRQMGTIPMAAAMAEGAQLAGTLFDDQGAIEVAATSTDGLYDVHIAMELTRSS
jgi:hypothetical protein